MLVDGFNQVTAGPTGNQGQMIPVIGKGGAIAPEGTSNMGTPLMSENGAMVTYLKASTYASVFINRIGSKNGIVLGGL